MGTTIHAHIEVKKNNKWLHFAAPNVESNYIVFAAINGERLEDFRESVRTKIHPQASITGLTDDISEVTAFCYEQDKKGYSIHGEGILTSNDIRNLQKHLYEINEQEQNYLHKYDLDETIFRTYINGNAISAHQGWDDVRIVFWYDN